MSAEGRAAGAVGWDIYTCMRVDCFRAPLLFTLAQETQGKYTESFSSTACGNLFPGSGPLILSMVSVKVII